jgi:D-alanine-D-alanine ligase-like ATP-grasp enzyme/acylphosphatase
MDNSYKWLKHLDGSIPDAAFGYPVSMYSIALEGWRRGLSLTFKNHYGVKAGTPYVLRGYGKEIEFRGTRSRSVSSNAIKICMNKDVTKEYLLNADVTTPKGFTFKDSDDVIIAASKELDFPLVLKPTDASGGKGVIANIKDESELMDALSYVRGSLGYEKVILEEYFDGNDYRLYVIDNKVIAAMYRKGANVIGDGVSSIQTLLKEKRKERKKNPGLYNSIIKKDKEMRNLLKSQGYGLESIPKANELVYLKTTSNLSSGGDSIDVTDELPDNVKEEAVRAIKAIPGLLQGGVDILYNEKSRKSTIIEINSQPSIRGHLFPMQGTARDIPKIIIDYYFPESKNARNINKPLFYFDIRYIFESFQSYTLEEIKVPNFPNVKSDDFSGKEFLIKGIFRRKGYINWIRNHAKSLKLYGFMEIIDDNNIRVIVAGEMDAINQFERIIKNNTPKNYTVDNIKEKAIENENCDPIKVGFEIIDSRTN